MTKNQHKRAAEAQENEWKSYERGSFDYIPFAPLNENQELLFEACVTSPLVIAQGPAGTAKSFVEASAAIELLTDKKSPV